MIRKLLPLVLALLAAPTITLGHAFVDLRDGKVHVRSAGGDTLVVDYQARWMADTHRDYVFLQSPTGALLARVELGFTDLSGRLDLVLDAGPGDYVLSLPSYTYRSFTVTIPDTLPAVYQPPKFYMNGYVADGSDTFWFDVPADAAAFTILGRADNANADSISVRDPDGALAGGLALPVHEVAGAYAPYDSLRVDAPVPGFWRLDVHHGLWPEKAAFWLDGIPNYVCTDTANWFLPEAQAGACAISGSGVIGDCALVGGVLGGNPVSEVMANVELMGLQSNNYYIGHDNREPVNDDGDPSTFTWSAFNWDDDYRMGVYTNPPYDFEMISIITPAAWLGEPVATQADMDELAEFLEAYLIHHNVENGRDLKYFTPYDEPNLQGGYDLAGYTQLVSTLGQRKNASPYPEVRAAKLLVPASSYFINAATSGELGVEWAEHIYQQHDADVDGIAFHVWQERDLLAPRFFADEIEAARRVIAENDDDGDPVETIIVEQTNMNSGDGSSPYYVNTFYASLWWAGVVCTVQNTGAATAVNWLTTVDDPHHRKGLMYDASAGYALKPVGHATRFLIDNILDEAVSTTVRHPEIYAMCSVDEARSDCRILVVNTGHRSNTASFDIELPSGLPLLMDLKIDRLQAGLTEAVRDSSCSYSGSVFDLRYTLAPRSIYAFRLEGGVTGVHEDPEPGAALAAGRSVPNPFNARTTIPFTAPRRGRVRIEVFDARGRRVRRLADAVFERGAHEITWDGTDDAGAVAATGLYVYRVEMGGVVRCGKAMLVK